MKVSISTNTKTDMKDWLNEHTDIRWLKVFFASVVYMTIYLFAFYAVLLFCNKIGLLELTKDNFIQVILFSLIYSKCINKAKIEFPNKEQDG